MLDLRQDLLITIKTFINSDYTVDGELRITLPNDWRDEEGRVRLLEFLSHIMRSVGPLVRAELGGAFWVAFGVRFGPASDAEVGDLAELYKRFRGLFQVATYATEAGILTAIIINVTNLGVVLKSLMEKRGVPPAVIFVRFTWTPDGARPARYEGEGGGGR